MEKKSKSFMSKSSLDKFAQRGHALECVFCGSTRFLCIDHIIPKARRGKNTWDNKQLLCCKCNMAKGCLLESEFDTTRMKEIGYRRKVLRKSERRNLLINAAQEGTLFTAVPFLLIREILIRLGYNSRKKRRKAFKRIIPFKKKIGRKSG